MSASFPMLRVIKGIILFCLLVGGWFLYSEIYTAEAQYADRITFQVAPGEAGQALADRLEKEQIVRNGWLFQKYTAFKKIDRQIQAGTFVVTPPLTLARVADALQTQAIEKERTITIIPGWDLREIAAYLEKEGVGTAEEFLRLTGEPVNEARGRKRPAAWDKYSLMAALPNDANLEGYLAPDTYRVFTDATFEDIIGKLVAERDTQVTVAMKGVAAEKNRSIHEVMTIASLVEREVRTPGDRAKVADIFWRRADAGWALQADSTVHYITGKDGSVFTTAEDRNSLSPWNTYKYPGLPPGPIAMPSEESIVAAFYPEANENWYFMTTFEGDVKYGRTLEEHNANVQRYLR